jgi:plasmid stabilization system protein ParE
VAHRVTWNPKALQNLDRLESFLAEKSPRAAAEAIVTIMAATDVLIDFPFAGRRADDLPDDRRELLVAFGRSGYVVAYQVRTAWIEILDVRHMLEAGFE